MVRGMDSRGARAWRIEAGAILPGGGAKHAFRPQQGIPFWLTYGGGNLTPQGEGAQHYPCHTDAVLLSPVPFRSPLKESLFPRADKETRDVKPVPSRDSRYLKNNSSDVPGPSALSGPRSTGSQGYALLRPVRGLAALVSILAAGVLSWPILADARDLKARSAFYKLNPCPVTGKTRGPCPGWVIDHAVPLCLGGPDTPANMQWLTVEQARTKDRPLVAQCRALRKARKN